MAIHIIFHILHVTLGLAWITSAAPAPVSSTSLVGWDDTIVPFEASSSSSKAREFSLSQVRHPSFSTPPLVNWTELYISALRKFNSPIPDAVYGRSTGILEERQSTINLTGNNIAGGWTFPIGVGTPLQTLYLLLDTGSTDEWVFSDAMPSSETAGHNYIYHPSKSSTSYFFSGQTWSLEYGDANTLTSASGNVYQDTFCVGSYCIDNFPIQTATQVSSGFAGMDGIFGINWGEYQNQAPVQEPTWLDYSYGNGYINFFSVNFHRSAPGLLTFNDVDPSQYTGTAPTSQCTPAYVSTALWAINITSYSFGTTKPATIAFQAYLDTGTTLTVLPSTITNAYYAKVTGAELASGTWIFPCTTTLPDFHLLVEGGYNVTYHGPYLNMGTVSSPSGYCLGGLQPSTDIIILGEVLYQSLYVLFSFQHQRVCFATKKLS